MIWVFGDSFSADFEKYVPWKESNVNSYFKYKGYIPKSYSKLLSEKTGHDVINQSVIGCDNSLIFLTFMNTFSQIKDDDVVLIGWTAIERFKYAFEKQWYPSKSPNFDVLSENTFDELTLHRENVMYMREQMSIISFIEKILKTQKVFQWTWSTIVHSDLFMKSTITHETNGVVDDIHFGEIGHLKLFEHIHNEFKTKDKVKLNTKLWENENRNIL